MLLLLVVLELVNVFDVHQEVKIKRMLVWIVNQDILVMKTRLVVNLVQMVLGLLLVQENVFFVLLEVNLLEQDVNYVNLVLFLLMDVLVKIVQ